ncbi:hypothetical protein SASPL_123316 [Salvia splendens]|uniref:Myb/SANT-like domain-containing protein n=1 Tax=Salvia splendens TaxID=180675 RepID=A0A8X8XNB0_SALSN|nr:hypothetical protein SASPL_123316 [Salvia splendens]
MSNLTHFALRLHCKRMKHFVLCKPKYVYVSWLIRGHGVRATEIPSDGNTGAPPRKFRKGDRSRRMWTVREEKILDASMLELLARGWKSDNGFRAGYLGKIEDSLRKEFPNTDLKGTSHITSKITAWKRSYTSLTKILARSGMGSQFLSNRSADKDAKFMRTKSWLLWETLKAIFGKDRASGVGAEQVDDAANRMCANVAGGSEVSGNEVYNSGNNDKQTSTNKSGDSQKRKHDGADATLMEFLSNLHVETNSRLEVISSRICYEFDLGKAKQDVFDELETVEGLTLDQRYELCNILSDKPQRLGIHGNACSRLSRITVEAYRGESG